jgi:hypothetical protein
MSSTSIRLARFPLFQYFCYLCHILEISEKSNLFIVENLSTNEESVTFVIEYYRLSRETGVETAKSRGICHRFWRQGQREVICTYDRTCEAARQPLRAEGFP